MSEYWKSLPRKFCDACKCWFADNKASIEFHEKGKRHQENVQKRINDIQKRGLKEFKKRKDMENTMDKIEKAALAAYKKDLQNNLVPNSQQELASIEIPSVKIETKSEVHKSMPKQKEKKNKMFKKPHVQEQQVNSSSGKEKKWYEGKTEDGHKYYWNIETSESVWEAPEEGFLSIEEQAQQSEIDSTNTEVTNESEVTNHASEKVKDDVSLNMYGPQPKYDPYGQWISVEHKVEEPIDLQLPKSSEDVIEAYITIPRDEPQLKFKEKVIGQISSSDSDQKVLFKKRKFLASSKKNTRQRTEDD